MENNLNLEQPEIMQETGDVIEQNSQEMKSPLHSAETGSNYGKFKDATSLLNAYNNLQKEFTRKSQKLAEYIKNETNNNDNIGLSEDKIANDIDNTKEVKDNLELPIYKRKDWKEKVTNFFKINNEAKKYSKQIAEMIVSDPKLSSSEDCLKYAYALIEQNNRVDTASLLNDPKFLQENIYNNEMIKNKIIEEYLLDIKQNKNTFKLISGEAQKISPTPTLNKPKNLKEASNILKQLLG